MALKNRAITGKCIVKLLTRTRSISWILNLRTKKNRSIYNDAVHSICGRDLCRVSFYLRGDPKPPQTSLRDFFILGGFGQTPALAAFIGSREEGEFTHWDCERAGVEGAPLGALCGPGVRENYDAVLSLAGRAGQKKVCRWDHTDDADLTRSFIASVKDKSRQSQYQEALNILYQNGDGSIDNVSECAAVKQRTQADVDAARKRFRKLLAAEKR